MPHFYHEVQKSVELIAIVFRTNISDVRDIILEVVLTELLQQTIEVYRLSIGKFHVNFLKTLLHHIQ